MTPSYILLFQVPITSPKSKTPSPSPRRTTVHPTLRKRRTCPSSTFTSPPPCNPPPFPRHHPCHSSLSLQPPPPPHRQKISTRQRAKKSHGVTPVLAKRRRKVRQSVRPHNTSNGVAPVTNSSIGGNSGKSRQRRNTTRRPNQTRRARTRRMVSEAPLTLDPPFLS